MLAYTYIEKGKFALVEKPKPLLIEPTDAIVRVTMGSICSSDLHIKHGSVPRAVPGITVGHEMVGVVEEVGADVTNVKLGDRVTVNVETFCGECFFCKNGYVNNCTNPNGGWALGCRIDGGQTEYVRVPLANQGLNRIPDSVTDEQALLVGDVLATGFWATRISEITQDDTVLIIGAGPTGICTLLCVMLKQPKCIIVCENSEERRRFVQEHYPEVLLTNPEECKDFVLKNSDHGGADRVLEVAGADDTFRLAWECASRSTRHYSRSRNGGRCRRCRCGCHPCKARRSSDSECRNLLRRVLLLQEWLCEQLHRPQWRLGSGLSHRWRTSRICACTLGQSRIEPYSR